MEPRFVQLGPHLVNAEHITGLEDDSYQNVEGHHTRTLVHLADSRTLMIGWPINQIKFEIKRAYAVTVVRQIGLTEKINEEVSTDNEGH